MRKQSAFHLFSDNPAPEKHGLDGALFHMHSPGTPGGGGGGPRGGGGHGGPGGGFGHGGPPGGGFGMGHRPPPPHMWGWRPYYRRPGCGCFTLVILSVVIVIAIALIV